MSTPSTDAASREFPARESGEVAPLGAPFTLPFPGLAAPDGFAPPCAAQVLVNPVVGVGPADASARRHADPDGVPAAPFPFASFALKSSEAEVHEVPQLVPRLAPVGTPGEASAVEQVDAYVGSSALPTPAAPAANDPVAFAIRFARTFESDIETSLWVASASAEGPDVVGDGADPSGAEGSGSDVEAFIGTAAVVPGPVADVEPLDDPVEAGLVVELDAVMGSLVATVAGPASPPLADADPPAVDPCGPGRRSGCAENVGPSASAAPAHTLRSARTAMSSSSFLIS